MKTSLLVWTEKIESEVHNLHNFRRVLNRQAAEIGGERLMRLLGVGTAEVRLVPKTEESEYPTNWIRKHPVGDSILLVKKVPKAISLDWLRVLYGIQSEPIRYKWRDDIGLNSYQTALFSDSVQKMLEHGKWWKLGNGIEFFKDFVPPRDTKKLLAAIQWNATPRLKINAARLLFGISAAHVGNVLTDANGNLSSIDHEAMLVSDGKDIEVLAENIRRPSLAYAVIQRTVDKFWSSSEEYIDIILDGLPEPWTMGSKAATAAYFKRRLQDFQEKFRA